jgi:hypothetical protein
VVEAVGVGRTLAGTGPSVNAGAAGEAVPVVVEVGRLLLFSAAAADAVAEISCLY